MTGLTAASILSVGLLAGVACSDSSSGTTSDVSSTDAGSPSDAATADSGTSTLTCDTISATTQTIVDAANAFLATLSSSQVATVQMPLTRDAYATTYVGAGNRLGEQYGAAVWSNYPASDVIRPGIARKDLTAAQLAAEDALLAAALSADGLLKVHQIMGADDALCAEGQNFTCGTGVYTIGIFGTPSTSAPWMIEVGGHHLGLNVSIDGNLGTVAPTLTGAQPASYTAPDGTAVRALAAENDKAFALLDALDDTQRGEAVATYAVGDLVLGPGKLIASTALPAPEGLKGSSLTAAQRTMLVDVISPWAGIINSQYTCARTAEIEAGLDDTYFFWSGPTTHDAGKNGTSYYRIQGPKVWIEFSPQGANTGGTGGGGMMGDGGMMGGGPMDGGGTGAPVGDAGAGGDTGTATDTSSHVHTVYRDPTNEYGHTW